MAEESKEKKDKNTSYSGSMANQTNNIVAPKEKKITIQFRENRKFDLHIGREMITFKGREVKQVPSSWISHKDWQNVKNYFIVKGV